MFVFTIYDTEDNIVAQVDGYLKLCEFMGTTKASLQSYFSNVKAGRTRYSLNKKDKNYYFITKYFFEGDEII